MGEDNALERFKSANRVEKERLIEKVGGDACHYEKTVRGCCQSTLAAIQDNLKIGSLETFKAASALSGGVGGIGEVCGALLAGVISIGLVYGRDNRDEVPSDSKAYQDARERAGKLADKFKEEFGSVRCRDILKKLHGRSFNLRDPIDRKTFSVPDIHDKCADITCKKAGRMAVNLLLGTDED